MKKQFLILATTITTLVFISCSKEKIETIQTGNDSEVTSAMNNPNMGSGNFFLNSLTIGLKGRFEFNGNLKDATNNLFDGIPTLNATVSYTSDRKGVANNAIQFTGSYGIDILNVPYKKTMSVAAWVKYSSSTVFPSSYFVTSDLFGPSFSQQLNKYWAVISTPATTGVPSGPMDDKWHHLVATYDATFIKLYVDGIYIGSAVNKCAVGPGLTKYYVGYMQAGASFWQGSIDDLRFYDRVLTDTEAKKLSSL